MKGSALICMLFLSVLAAGEAAGYSLYFDPADQAVGLGETAEVSVWISGLGTATVSSLGAYDISLSYNASLLKLKSITFHEYLGLSGLGSFSTIPSGTVRVQEVSLLSPAALAALQPDSFPLVSLEFSMLVLADSRLDFVSAGLSDGNGAAFQAGFQSATVTAVPIPPPAILLSGALLGLGTARRLRKSRRFFQANRC